MSSMDFTSSEAESDSDEEFQEQVNSAHMTHSWAESMLVSLLCESVTANRIDRVHHLLTLDQFGTNIASAVFSPEHERQPLHLAAVITQADGEVIRALCDAGAPVNQPDKLGLSPARLALMFGRFDALKELRAYGADLDFLPGLFRESILSETCECADVIRSAFYGNALALREALGANAVEQGDVSVLNEEDREELMKKALKYGAWRGHCEVVNTLLASGVPAEFEDEDGITPLAYAVRCGHTEVARCLLEAGASANQLSSSGMSLMEAAISRNNMELLRVLLDFVQCPNFINNEEGQTALMKAVAYNSLEAIQMLLSSGADINRPIPGKATVLIASCVKGSPRSRELLLKAGADVNALSENGAVKHVSALMIAAWGQKKRCIRQLLLCNQLKIDHVDSCGRTALHYCSLTNNTAGAMLLLRAGIDKTVKTYRGITAALAAEGRGCLDLAKLIRLYRPLLEELCLRKIRQSLPSLITNSVVQELPLPNSMRKKVLFL